jgi:hypothetical protein
MHTKTIQWFGKPFILACDGQCDRAFGIQHRQRVQFSDDPDDFAMLSDDETGEAPKDPGTYEGGFAKPSSPDDMNKWCARECERSDMAKAITTIALPDFTKRLFNQPWKHQAAA